MSRPKLGLVLAGGAARGAYEVGVIQHLVEDVAKDVGHDVPLDVVCGTSVGAINACAMAAFAHEPKNRAERLIRQWSDLRVGHVVRIDSGEILSMVGGLFRAGKSGKKGGILDPAGMQRIVMTSIPFDWIHENIRAGRVQALTVSTTHVATGRTFVFVERHEPGLPPWSRDPTVVPIATEITPAHAFASAAIPFLFPAVPIDGEYHCDGGLRQNVPLSPARRLGADSLIVISPKFVADDEHAALGVAPDPGEQPSPLFLLGKTLNALLLDRIDNDIARLRRTTEFLLAGERVYGPTFVAEINRAMGNPPERAVRPLQTVLVKATKDISKMAAEFVRSPAFSSRASGIVARLLRRMAEGESDLLSYLLFDGEFARQLIELGRADARAHHEELCRLVSGDEPTEEAAAAG